ncbi:hypothetical protein LshimejAT787_1403170 [Lyophyllum shimeji]|uniref:Uncharacterized protein n=1 Tax=Lyophyllum shimeji TaxID=47721 RepID=A0A9P3PXG3_LYOSH|nr:hypothetical protein LshimejAT787_1403170 [Lyophyllum shimeji]
MTTAEGPEAQDSLFESGPGEKHLLENVPPTLVHATLRLQFPPTYVIVGVYRLFTDKLLYVPAWDKCRHATRRGAIVGAIWAALTFSIQRKFIQIFLAKSPRVTGLSNETIFGYEVPFSVTTYAALLLLGSQITYILRFFLSRNIRIARDRAWTQTVVSRGKGPDFWQPYVEEWDVPPVVRLEPAWERFVKRWLGGWVGLFVVRRVILFPFNFYPFVGIAVAAAFKALGTAHNLHRPYFEAKKMNDKQIATFIEERKWDYRLFGFAAALLEGLPIIGLVFTISNRVGAAMWAHDLEKRQHFVAAQRDNRPDQ